MGTEIAIVRYTVREAFEEAVDSVRRALEGKGLRIAGRLDISMRVARTLGIRVPACQVLFVLPREFQPDPLAAILLPLHVVVEAANGHTSIEVQNRLASPAILGTQRRLAEALETVAARETILA